MAVRVSVAVSAAVAALALLSGCSDGSGSNGSTTTSATPTTVTPDARQQRNLRIHQRLLELGCTTNSCIQTYFACMDGYLTGDACEFFRQHPPPE
ncbi:hypothetical protein [Nocardia sp. NPDC050710]|uniref:hypothetical protein n=1 Tax=Nocardia sp. NPDC050710 TaxID=3157220 RepID=UPI0033CE9F2E